jgi:hypothetical protein
LLIGPIYNTTSYKYVTSFGIHLCIDCFIYNSRYSDYLIACALLIRSPKGKYGPFGISIHSYAWIHTKALYIYIFSCVPCTVHYKTFQPKGSSLGKTPARLKTNIYDYARQSCALCSGCQQLVFIGDPNQLPPTICDRLSIGQGLECTKAWASTASNKYIHVGQKGSLGQVRTCSLHGKRLWTIVSDSVKPHVPQLYSKTGSTWLARYMHGRACKYLSPLFLYIYIYLFFFPKELHCLASAFKKKRKKKNKKAEQKLVCFPEWTFSEH